MLPRHPFSNRFHVFITLPDSVDNIEYFNLSETPPSSHSDGSDDFPVRHHQQQQQAMSFTNGSIRDYDWKYNADRVLW